jgi:hypothetical protein
MVDQPLNQRLRALRESRPDAVEEPETAPEPAPRRRAPLGRLLVGKGLIDEDTLDTALEQQRKDGRPLGQILIEMGAVSRQNLARTLTEQGGFDFSGSLRARLSTAEGVEAPVDEDTAESFLLRETTGSEPLFAASTFLDAADAAFEVIEDRDPEQLEILRSLGGELENVWTYERADEPAPPPPPPLYPA